MPGAFPLPAYTYYGSPSPGSPLLGPHSPASAGTAPYLVPAHDPHHHQHHQHHHQHRHGRAASPHGQVAHSPPLSPVFMYVRTDTTEELDPRNVYIRSLPEDCDDAALEALAAPYGAIESSKSIMDEATGKCKGYGFVMYQTEDQAAHAIAALNAMGLHSSLARDSLKSKLKRLQDRNSTNVYVANLPADMDEARLVELLRPHRVVSAKILRDSATGQHRSVGFARMEDRESAMAAIELLKGMVLPNAPAPLSPRIADSADQKRLKRLFGVAGPPRLPTADDVALVRSANASPAMWSPVLVYTPAGSPPPMLPLPAAVDHYPGYPPPPPAFGYASPPGGYASPPRHQFPIASADKKQSTQE
ncbi:hypothetical protein H4R18_005962 [Coemansia javaensis]|uniref:RRM domain-containing protein n=2 Tax=Coemansia javaensis TaxID=2761396 RepID=A0A9W8H3S5_9FUNG|nr:hypothetical protein H4R18_005962 [Coemansia javaensis]